MMNAMKMTIDKPRRSAAAAVSIFFLSLFAACGASENDFELAMTKLREGYVTKAIEELEEIVDCEAKSPLGDRAALVLGNLLIRDRRPAEAIEPLRRAAAGAVGAPYARLLIARAAIQGELEDVYAEASEHAFYLHNAGTDEVTPLLRQEATFLLAKLYALQGRWGDAARYGEMFLDQPDPGRRLDEARWVTAQARRQSERTAEAHELYATIWFETPGSPWAIEARQAMAQIERSAGFSRRGLEDHKHYEFIQGLRRAGLHEDAVKEIDRLVVQYPRYYKVDGALFMKVMSLHALRRNDECVRTADELRRKYPRSQWTPEAAIYAVKCLRRGNNTPQIRSWVNWILANFPGHEKAYEALYNLGGYLGNVVDEEEGLPVLERLAREGGRHPDVRNALWRMTWLHRNQGRTDRAIATLEQLVRDHPDSAYRRAALYWLARFQGDYDPARAIELYQTCVAEFPNDYYGHKAMEKLIELKVKPRQIGRDEPFPAVDTLSDPAARPGAPPSYRRAAELKAIGLYEFAAAELETVPGVEDDHGLQFALAELYSRSGNTWEAATIVRRRFDDFVTSGSRNPEVVPIEFWHVVYPFNYRREIEESLAEAGLLDTGIDPYLAAALIRRESHFLPTAISHAGAVGLMQLMPDLVEHLAAKLNLGNLNRNDLFDPRTNIHLGTYHLADLIRRFDGDWFPAICSYNAGEGAVKRWWSQRPRTQPLDEFIENIPYVDTRIYVKQILGDYKNYEWIYPGTS